QFHRALAALYRRRSRQAAPHAHGAGSGIQICGRAGEGVDFHSIQISGPYSEFGDRAFTTTRIGTLQTGAPDMKNRDIGRLGSVCSILAVIYPTAAFVLRLLEPPRGLPSTAPSGLPRLQTILLLGWASAAAHGILWACAQQLFYWKLCAGCGAVLLE